jgi:MFS family permease
MEQVLPARGQRMLRVIPVAFLMYTVAFMDRVNLGLTLPAMSKDLHFSATIAGLVSGIFVVGRLILPILGGHLAERWSAIPPPAHGIPQGSPCVSVPGLVLDRPQAPPSLPSEGWGGTLARRPSTRSTSWRSWFTGMRVVPA